MSIYEMMCIAKLCSVAWKLDSVSILSKYELDIAIETLKKVAERNETMTEAEKEFYKLLTDTAKELLKKEINK